MNKKIFLLIAYIFILISIISLFYNKRFNNGGLNYSNTNSNINNDKFEYKENDNDFFNSDNKLILVIADSHLYKESFIKIKEIIRKYNIKLAIHLGDHTDFGSDKELKLAKSYLDDLGIGYIALPGDRDLAAYSGDRVFYEIFEKVSFLNFEGVNLSFINNSANFTPLNNDYLLKSLDNIRVSRIIFFSQPVFVEKGNILESKYMGSPTAFNLTDKISKNNQEIYLAQRNKILNSIRESEDVLVVAGDHHRSAFFVDPIKKSIKYHIVGSSAEFLNSEGIQIKQKAFQPQRVSILSVNPKGSIHIKEITLFEE